MAEKTTVVIMNDRMGGMAYAFQSAGFDVLCDALTDIKCINIVRNNLNINAVEMEKDNVANLPQATVLAGRMARESYVIKGKDGEKQGNYINQNILLYIERYLPKQLFFETSKRHINEKEFVDCFNRCVELGYKLEYRTLGVLEITGIPIREERMYIMGSRSTLNIELQISADKEIIIPWREILDTNTEESYFSFNDICDMKNEGDGVYDWKKDHYEKSELVSLGWRIPRVVEHGLVRSLSINEIARMKGFPEDYRFVNSNKAWIKRNLCVSTNVIICKKMAEQIYRCISEYETNDDVQMIESDENRSTTKECRNKEEGTMERRYDVFVSSTYEDLVEERKEITQAVLECDCMPVGMEMFPASNLEQWEFIKKVIDKSDIYLVIVAGKYGSIGIDEEGERVSYTEMEFDYALKKGKPILVFLHKDIDKLTRDKIELDDEKAKALEKFRNKIKKDRLVKFYTNKDDLRANALSSINSIKKQINSGGWIRAEFVSDYVGNVSNNKSIELQNRNVSLMKRLEVEHKEKESILQELKKTQIMFQDACKREKNMLLQHEKIKMKVTELAKELE